ncbi:hypothetical protein [Bacterioplanoides sp.]|uniref:hypothetical protein n=1 Tax=Bacterioplanoides sp. TaxID=2066072 RepID=UPI003B00D7E7
MFEHIKKRITKNLIDEINCLDAVALELIGHNLISIQESRKMIHHGVNKDYKPSGYTVDSFSEDSTVVGEYSTEKSYFNYQGTKDKPVYEKIDKDVYHAISHKSPDGPEIIYLICSQEEPPSFRAIFNKTEVANKYASRIKILDSREIAKTIYEQSIQNPSSADFYKAFFPGFSQDLDNYEYYGKVPARCDNHIRAEDILELIARHFENNKNICVIHGVSGSGKTQLAIDFIHHAGKSFDNYIWISGDDWVIGNPLSSIQRSRGGVPINISGLFNTSKTILVIDNINSTIKEESFKELSQGFDKGGVVLITSQKSSPNSDIYFPVPRYSSSLALKILGLPEKKASNKCLQFINACSFSPLILSMTRTLSNMEGVEKEDIYDEVLNDPEVLKNDDGISVMQKILGKLGSREHDALKEIASFGCNAHDINFLRYAIGIIPCNNLQHLSILMPANTTGILRIHDLVSIAVREEIRTSETASKVNDYIDKYKGEMTPSILREIHLSYPVILQEHTKRDKNTVDWLTYALLQINNQHKQEIHELLHNREIDVNSPLPLIMCIIDAKEAHSYTIESHHERKAYYRNCVEAYDRAEGETTDSDIKAEFLHHKAKALRRSGNHDDALSCCLQLIELKPDWHATYAQIAHLGIQYGVPDSVKEHGEKAMVHLIEEILHGSSKIPLRVSLSIISKLRSYKDLIQKLSNSPDKIRSLSDVIALSALEGLDQFYEAFVSFTSIFGYQHSDICVNLVQTFPEMLSTPPEQVERKQWVSACEALTNTAIAAGRMNKIEMSTQLSNSSVMFADEISKKETLTSFAARAVAKSFIIACNYTDALKAIDKVPEDKVDHWLLYRKAEALLGNNDNEDALEVAKESLNKAENDKYAQTRLSIYHELISKCHEALGCIKYALDESQIALEKCQDSKYQSDLLERVEFLANALTSGSK